MRFALLIAPLFVPGISWAQSTKGDVAGRAHFVGQCSSAARLAGTIASTYPDNEANRAESFKIIVHNALNPPFALTERQKAATPTLKQYNTAFIVMEALVNTESGKSPEALNEQIISEAAATCMAASLEP